MHGNCAFCMFSAKIGSVNSAMKCHDCLHPLWAFPPVTNIAGASPPPRPRPRRAEGQISLTSRRVCGVERARTSGSGGEPAAGSGEPAFRAGLPTPTFHFLSCYLSMNFHFMLRLTVLVV